MTFLDEFPGPIFLGILITAMSVVTVIAIVTFLDSTRLYFQVLRHVSVADYCILPS